MARTTPRCCSLFEQNERKVEEFKRVTGRETGRPRGFGFGGVGSIEHAGQAVSELNGHELDGRRRNVNEARGRDGPRS